MRRPRLASVDHVARTMTLEFTTTPPRFVTVPMRSKVLTPAAAFHVAQGELDAIDDATIAVFADMATVDYGENAREIAATIAATYENVRRVRRLYHATGSIFCPRCAYRLGHAASPHLGYLDRCNGCKRPIVVTRDGDLIVVSVQEPTP